MRTFSKYAQYKSSKVLLSAQRSLRLLLPSTQKRSKIRNYGNRAYREQDLISTDELTQNVTVKY